MTTARATRAASPLALWSALGIVYVVWGSTYLGIRVVVDVAGQPPLFPTGVRFVIAGSILGTVLVLRRGRRALATSPRAVLGSVVLGFLFLFCGVGMVSTAEQTVPSGLAALLVAAMPLWVVLMRTGIGRERPRWLTWVGTVVGLGGIAVLARPGHPGRRRALGRPADPVRHPLLGVRGVHHAAADAARRQLRRSGLRDGRRGRGSARRRCRRRGVRRLLAGGGACGGLVGVHLPDAHRLGRRVLRLRVAARDTPHRRW